MAVQEIELRIDQNQSPFFTISSKLSGRVYALRFTWSHRWASWYLDLDQTLFGIKIVNSIDLFSPYHYNDDVPPGKLGAAINKGRSSKPFFDNFGIEKEITLAYIEP
jgi:hypothetical protein